MHIHIYVTHQISIPNPSMWVVRMIYICTILKSLSCNANVDLHKRLNSLVIYQSAVYADPRTRDTSNLRCIVWLFVRTTSTHFYLFSPAFIQYQIRAFIWHAQKPNQTIVHLRFKNCYFRFTPRTTYIILPFLHYPRSAVETIFQSLPASRRRSTKLFVVSARRRQQRTYYYLLYRIHVPQ